MNLTELDVATRIRDGTLASPFKFSNVWLVDLRITGTGAAYRSKYNEHVWRNPDEFLTEEFLRRCNGLPVIINHPDNPMMDDDDFKDRIVGTVMIPYIKGDEVWAVCRIYFEEIIPDIVAGKVSTSPGVVFGDESGNVVIDAGNETVLIEGKPFLIDHIALVTEDFGTLGVWDKRQVPEGITITNTGNSEMTEEEMKKLLAESFSGISAKIDNVVSRMDSLEKKTEAEEQARKDAAEAEEKARKDAEEQARKDAAEAEEQARKDAEEQARKDAAEAEEKAKKDAEEQERKDAAEADEKAEYQARADNAYQSFGQRARAPMRGESATDYRRRLLKGLQQYSEEYKNVDIMAIHDAALLGIAERKIYADAAAYSKSGAGIPVGQLRMISRKDEAGRTIREFKGDVRAFLAPVTGGFHQFSGLKNGDK